MARRILLAEEFIDDVRAQVAWLVVRHEWSRIEALELGIQELERHLAAFPAAGVGIQRDGTVTLRKVILRKLPFVVWYVHDDASSERGRVWLLRLFHARQSTPTPNLSTWRRAGPR